MINSYQQRLLKFGFLFSFLREGVSNTDSRVLKIPAIILDQYIMNIIYGVK